MCMEIECSLQISFKLSVVIVRRIKAGLIRVKIINLFRRTDYQRDHAGHRKGI